MSTDNQHDPSAALAPVATDAGRASIVSQYRHPVAFFGWSMIGSAAFWLVAARLSRIESKDLATQVLFTFTLAAGLVFPLLTAMVLARRNPQVWVDFRSRLFRFGPLDRRYSLIGAAILFASIVLGQAISLLFGYSASQFRLAEGASFSAGLVAGGFVLIVAPIVEELSWHSYGTDALRARFSLFWASMIFAVYWVIWHLPLALVDGLYQSEVAESGWIYSLNFVLSILPFVLLMNWLYYRADRSVIVAVVFHTSAGVFNEMFQTHPMSKVIQTGLLLILTVWVIARDRRMFFRR